MKQELLEQMRKYCINREHCSGCCFRVGQELECGLGKITRQLLCEIEEEKEKGK